MTARAQSEVVGVVLMTAVVVLAVSLFGTFYLQEIGQDGQQPRTNVRAALTTESLALVHGGGDALPTDEVRVIVRISGDTALDDTLAGASSATLSGGADGRFDPGDRWTRTWTRSIDADEEVSILVAHSPSGAVLFETVRTPGDGTFRRIGGGSAGIRQLSTPPSTT